MNPSDAILVEAREAIRAAAERVRAMPDIDLVRLAMGGGASVPDSSPAERACRVCGCTEDDCANCFEKTGEACHWVEPDLCSACVPKAKAKAEKPRRTDIGRSQQVLEYIEKHGPSRNADIVKALKISKGAASGALYPLLHNGLVESVERGLYVVKGTRQTGAKKTRKPPKGADEEEGAAVKLSLVHPAVPVPPAGHPPRLAPVRSTGPAPRVAGDETQERRNRICAEIATRGAVRWHDVYELRGLDRHVRSDDLANLLKTRRIFAAGLGLDSIVAVSAELLPKREDSGVFRLPVLLEGPGDRRSECALYDGCLDRFCRARKGYGGPAHARCPPNCASFTEVPSHVRFGLAMTGAVSALARASET